MEQLQPQNEPEPKPPKVALIKGESHADASWMGAVEAVHRAINETRWIPVTERMPEVDGDYLVVCGDGNMECTEYVSAKDKSVWPALAGWYGETGPIYNVTHWQPPPPPPPVDTGNLDNLPEDW
jgi:hypothetical protein